MGMKFKGVVLAAAVGATSTAEAKLLQLPGSINVFDGAGGHQHIVYAHSSASSPDDYAFTDGYLGLTITPLNHLLGDGTAFYTPADSKNHVVYSSGAYTNVLTEYYYGDTGGVTSNTGLMAPTYSSWGSITHLAGFVSSDNVEHLVMTMSSGAVLDLQFGPYIYPQQLKQIGSFTANSLVDVAGYQAADGTYHAIVAQATTITEIFYTSATPSGIAPHDVLQSGLTGVNSVAAYSWSVDTSHNNRVLFGVNGTTDNACAFSYGTGGITTVGCETPPGTSVRVTDVSGYYPPTYPLSTDYAALNDNYIYGLDTGSNTLSGPY